MLLETLFAGAVACVEGNGKECASLPFFKEVGHESVVELPFECDRAERPALARCGTFTRSSAPCSQENENVASFLIMVSRLNSEKD